MTDAIQENAQSLGEQILELPEYSSFVDAANEYENHDKAQERLSQVRQLENEIMALQESGGEPEELENKIEELEAAENELHHIEVVQNYFDAAENLEVRLGEINEIISEDLNIDFAQAVY